MKIKIDNDIFLTKNSSIQYGLMDNITAVFTFDLQTHPSYKDFFLSKFDNSYKFNIESLNYYCRDCLICGIDFDISNMLLNITIKSSKFEEKSLIERRDETLDNLLN